MEWGADSIWQLASAALAAGLGASLFCGLSYRNKIKSLTTDLEREQQRRQRFAEAIDLLTFPLWMRDEGGVIRFCNHAYGEIAGQADDTGAIRNLTPQCEVRSQKARSANQPQKERTHIIVKGERRLYEIMETPTSNGGTLGIALDWSFSEAQEEELGHISQALTEIMENSGSAMVLFDGKRTIRKYNQAFVHLWGFDEPYLATAPRYEEILEVLREQRRLPEQANFQAFRKEQLSYFTDLTAPHQDFFYLPEGTSLRVVAIPYASGGMIFIYENMTDRLALEQSFNQTVAVKKATLDNLFEGVAMFGEDGRLKLSNPRFAELWQLDWEFIEKQPRLSDLLEAIEYLFENSERWKHFSKLTMGAINERRRATEKQELIDGRVIQWSCLPLPDGAALLTYLDITDSARVEQNLRERNRVLEEAAGIKTKFLANVSYELRSPLTSIRGFAEFLIEGVAGEVTAKQKEYLKDIYQSTTDLSAMIDDVLDVASLEAGYITLDVAEFDVYMMLSSIFPFLQEKLNRLDIHLNFQCSPAIGSMVGDERRVRHTLLQVLDNMIKFCSRGSDILFKVWEEDDSIIVLMQDVTHIETQGHLSGPNVVEVSTSRSSLSSVVATDTLDAIGSPVIRSLLTMHGGTIDVTYTNEQRCRVFMRLKRRHSAFDRSSANVQLSSAL